MDIGQASIDKELFLDGSEVRDVVDAMMAEAREALQYMRMKVWKTQEKGGGGLNWVL